MNRRLRLIADNIRECVGVIDVGTDHGYLPAYLAQNGYEGNIFASDINSAPLEKAKETAKEAGVTDKIKFLLCDGLADCPPYEVDTIVIAGMGGDNIVKILDEAEWCMEEGYKLILQPMSKQEILRYWLVNNGFPIKSELFVEDGGSLYQIIIAEYGYNMPLSDAELYIGKAELANDIELYKRQLTKLVRRFKKAVGEMRRGKSVPEYRIKLFEEISMQLESMRSEYKITNAEVLEYMRELAPLELKMDFDNCGFLMGSKGKLVEKVLLCIDLTDEVTEEAISTGVNLIITHHPIIFNPLRIFCDDTPECARMIKLIQKGVSAISMHTNLDLAPGGVNDVLIETLGAKPEEPLCENGLGRVGHLEEAMPMEDFLACCREVLKTKGIRYYSSGAAVHKLAVVGGSGGDCVDAAVKKGCDTLVTADVKYHQFLQAKDFGLNLIDADHFCTEAPVMYSLQKKLAEKFPELIFTVSEKLEPIIDFA